jgi:general secretion pathway protein N
MNAAAQRRLTPVCAAVVAVFGILLLSLLFGVGRGVQWDPPRVTPSLPTPHSVILPSPPVLGSYAQVWEHPLFSSDRKPIVSNGSSEGVSLGDLQLTGVILTPTLHIALLGPTHDSKGDESQQVRVREGASLPDGNWKLIKVLPRSAIFASSSGRSDRSGRGERASRRYTHERTAGVGHVDAKPRHATTARRTHVAERRTVTTIAKAQGRHS